MSVKWKDAISRLLARGASYADVRFHPKEEGRSSYMRNGNLLGFSQNTEAGFGVRVLVDGSWGFAASSDINNIIPTFDKAFDNARAASLKQTRKIVLADKNINKGRFISPCRENPLEIPFDKQMDFMLKMDKALKQKGVDQRFVGVDATRKTVEYYDSEGAEIIKEITEIFPHISVSGIDADGLNQSRTYEPARRFDSRGWEIMDLPHWEEQAHRIVKELNETLVARDLGDGEMDVILMPDMMFLQVHETIGHALELDRILGYELSFAGGSFVRLEDFGSLQYGSKKLNARADATLINSPGSFGFDDDGVEAKNSMLIKDGILVGAITSRQMVSEANERAGRQIFSSSGGTARACNFYRVPIERMTNINVDPGDDGNLSNIISKTENGVILSGTKSWSIGSNREQFHFATDIGWRVIDGKQVGVVKNCSYSGKTLPFYRSLDMVGDESTWEVQYVSNCGKGAPSQVMCLGHGIPVCRFHNVKVGQ